MAFALALLVALAIDRWWGEPRARVHPVVWIGNYLGWVATWVQHGAQPQAAKQDLPAFWRGAVGWCVGAAWVAALAWVLQIALLALPWWAAGIGLGVLLKPLLTWAMLRDEVRSVEAALGKSLQAGRERLRWLVSRDVAQLSATEVRESAIETLAENLNDSVVAPIFWFVLLGLPGVALYRFANTADAMWGYPGLYKGRNWAWAGKWAARADDVLSWLPARITAVLLLLAAGWNGLSRAGTLAQEAHKTPSPNSGWPMAAMALNLGVALRKPSVYVLNPQGKPASAAHTALALRFASKALLALVVCAQTAMILVAFLSRGISP